jgi:acyl-CoA dehydrogenase
MNFDFAPEQEQFRDQIRRYLENSGGRIAVRRMMEGDPEPARALWAGLAELGALAVAIPEEYGGSDLGPLELCVVAEEIGRTLAPAPFLGSIGICAEAIRRHGSEEQRSRWLPGLADGSIIGTWAPSGGDTLAWRGDGVSGTLEPVLDGAAAAIMLIPTVNRDGAFVVALCALDQPGVDRRVVNSIDPSRPAASVILDGAAVTLLPDSSKIIWERLLDRAAVLLAFEQLGGAEAALSMARSYALDRSAFGRKIGSFQAIKHKLADMYARIELARGHCYFGAWATSEGAAQTTLAAAGARCSATEAMEFAAQETVQIHGGIGVTWESDCQFFYRRARLNALLLGPRHDWQDRLVEALRAQRVA